MLAFLSENDIPGRTISATLRAEASRTFRLADSLVNTTWAASVTPYCPVSVPIARPIRPGNRLTDDTPSLTQE